MKTYKNNFWKKAPFIKLLLPAIAGIMVQWQFQFSIKILLALFLSSLPPLISFFFIPFFKKYKWGSINGVFTALIFFSIGAMMAWQKDVRNDKHWAGNFYKNKDAVIVTLDEPPVEKTKSIKANGVVSYLFQNGSTIPVTGKIIVYFKKDPLLQLSYGSQIIFNTSLQEIKNSGNPGGFDYKRYSLFQGVTHQVFLKPGEFEILNTKKENWFRKFIYSCRDKVLSILQANIKGHKELGLSEALLIGYKDDLEQPLVQSYTNTGVVHIIAISGLHLGLIYWLLALLLRPLQKIKKLRWLRPVLIITGLWLFSILAGAQPSILRSALMFTCIVIGESLSKKTSIYNTMAVSAFILLTINPYWLWDVGFQLSYAAVLSIIIFMQPVYNLFYIKNKILDAIWKLNAVTIAAQILTVPLSIYHFHQFPNLFILTNFMAVPLSSAIVLAEIFLCAISFITPAAALTGKIITWFIWLMNSYIERIEAISFSLSDNLYINIWQAILLTLFAISCSYWLMEKSIKGLKIALFTLLAFVALRSYSFIISNQQQKLIVYNISQKRAIDIINGRNYNFIGDSDLLTEGFSRNFHLKPSRTLYRIKKADYSNPVNNYFIHNGKHVLLLDKTTSFIPEQNKLLVDLLVISKNPKIYMKKLAASLDIKQVVFDGSVPAWKSNYWKKDCDSLHIPWYDTNIKGAFVMNLN